MNSEVQKASMWKRISAFLFDGILLAIVAVLFAWLLSATFGYDGYASTLNERYAHYEAEYGVDFHMSLAEYEAMTEEESKKLDSAFDALAADDTAVHAYEMLIQLTFLILTFGILLSFLTMEFAVPMFLKDGRTLGKKVFGIALMRSDGVKVGGVTMFIRTVLGKYTIETMIAVYILIMMYFNSIGILGTLILLAIALIELILPLATKNHTALHDLIAGTIAVDFASQRIFDSQEEKLDYIQRTHAEKVAGQTN